MTIHQFFVRRSQIDPDGAVTIDGSDARHIRTVLRLKRDSRIRIVDDEQNLHTAVVEQVGESAVIVRILRTDRIPSPRTSLMVIQGVPRLPKTDLITQKLTELGVTRIVFAPMKYSPYRDALTKISGRADRLRRIAGEAAKQSARLDIPEIRISPNLESAVDSVGPGTLLIVADETEHGGRLRDCLSKTDEISSIAVVIGPEGGFCDEESTYLRESGIAVFSLGRNILRTETAAIVAAALILYEMGEI